MANARDISSPCISAQPQAGAPWGAGQSLGSLGALTMCQPQSWVTWATKGFGFWFFA